MLFCQRMGTPVPGPGVGPHCFPFHPGKKPFSALPNVSAARIEFWKTPGHPAPLGGDRQPREPPGRPSRQLPHSIPLANVPPKALRIPAGPEPLRAAGEGRSPGGCRGERLRGGSRCGAGGGGGAQRRRGLAGMPSIPGVPGTSGPDSSERVPALLHPRRPVNQHHGPAGTGGPASTGG